MSTVFFNWEIWDSDIVLFSAGVAILALVVTAASELSYLPLQAPQLSLRTGLVRSL